MRILSVHNFYQHPGGEDVVWRNEAALLRSKGLHVAEYVRSNSDIGRRGFAGALQLGVRTIWSRETTRQLAQTLRTERPHLVHFHNTFPLISPSAYYVCRDFGVPVVQTIHNYRLFCPAATFFRDGKICEDCVEHGLWRSVRYACYRGSRSATAATAAMLAVHRLLRTWRDAVDSFIVPSNFGRNKIAALGIPHQKIVVKPNFLASDPGCRDRAGDYAIFVGRLSPEKGVHTLVAAWSKLSSAIPLRILGDGPLRSELEHAASSVAPGRIQLNGWAERQAAIDAIKGACFLIFPSEWYETFGLVAVEAFACGVPVIASRLGVMAELVENDRTGLHFTAGDSDDLAVKIDWAASHPSKMREMGCHARAEYECKYTAEENWQQLRRIYNRVILAAGPRNDSIEEPPGELELDREKAHSVRIHSAARGQDAIQSGSETRFS